MPDDQTLQSDQQHGPEARISTIAELRERFGTGPLPVSSISDPALFELEKQKVFRKTWLKVAMVGEIPNPGDCKVKELEVLNTSLILAHGKDGKIRAFHNVCPHRGNLVVPPTGNETFVHAKGNVLVCRFHGWAFSTNGSLRGIPKKEMFGTLDTKCANLREVACDVWESFVFINMEPSQSLVEYMGGLNSVFGGYPFGESTQAHRYNTILNCNWKVALHAFSEGYHVPTIHAGSLPGFRGADHSDFKVMSPHASSTIFGGGMDAMAATTVFGQYLHNSDSQRPRPDQLPKSINPSGRKDFQFELPTVFPNLIIHLAAGCGYPGITYFTHQFWPLAHDRTLWEGITYFRTPATAAERAAQLHIAALHRNAWLEDTATMENTFKGVMSGAITEMPLMDQEFLIRHFTLTLDSYLAA
jgi:phenylpropionate dioxygenase-like ring-hydroxylating dioxygenase large terminal subunit